MRVLVPAVTSEHKNCKVNHLNFVSLLVSGYSFES